MEGNGGHHVVSAEVGERLEYLEAATEQLAHQLNAAAFDFDALADCVELLPARFRRKLYREIGFALTPSHLRELGHQLQMQAKTWGP